MEVSERDVRKVTCVEGVEVHELGCEEGGKEARADNTNDEAQHMQDAGWTTQLRGRGHSQNDEEHDDASTNLSAIVEGDADGFDVGEVDEWD